MSVRLEKSHVYRVRYRLPNDNGQWWVYEAVMTYLGINRISYAGQPKEQRETSWNLRPIAGTQTLQVGWLLEAEDLGKSQGRDDSRHKSKRKIERYAP